MLIVLLLTGCQEPFAEDRRDLASFRIAAVAAREAPEGLVELRAFVYSGLGLWHATPPVVTWTVGSETLTGPVVQAPAVYPLDVAVTAEGDGLESAVLSLAAPPTPPVLASWSRGVTDLTITDVVTPIEDRLTHVPGDDGPVAAGGGVRLAVETVDDGDRVTHWMTTGGQLAELDASTTDWFAGTAVLDDNEIESSATVGAGVYSVVALTLDGQGGNQWTTLDVAVDIADPLLHVGGRLFPVTTGERGEGWWEATVEAEESTAGIRLVDVAPGADPTGAKGTLCGVPAAQGFDFAALAEGWCARDELVGQRIVVWGEVAP